MARMGDAQGAADWKETKALALRLMETEREGWGQVLEGTDDRLAQQAREWAEEALAEPDLDDTAAGRLQKSLVFDSAVEPAAGARLGAYRLERLLGEGGSGIVYLARREDDFAHQAAIKILHADYSGEARRRFLREREILARLNHPYIARIVDGGATSEGKLYLVVEYVEGTPLPRHAAERKLGTRQKLELFAKVCEAVQYLHQSLIVHRDLKPGNILVGNDGNPKLLDFGVAKLLDDSGGDNAATSAFAPLTPEYASPEQIAGGDITVASDVYSLGVILYELLAERRPKEFSKRDWATVSREMQQAPAALKAFPDLDAIARKALELEPQERYGNVALLLADVRRYLAGEPVQALAHRRGYVLRKLAARYRWPIAAGMLVAASLSAGLWSTARESRIANEQRLRAEGFARESARERQIAQDQTRLALSERDRAAAQTLLASQRLLETARERAKAEKRFADVRQLSQTYLFNIHEKIRNLSGSLPAQQEVVRTALRYLESLRKESEADTPFLADLAEAYLRVGTIQGDAVTASFGKSEDAALSYHTARDLARKVEKTGTTLRARRVILRATQHLSAIGVVTRKWDEAARLADEAIGLAEREYNVARDGEAAADLLRSLTYRGDVDYSQRNLAAAVEWYTKGIQSAAPALKRFPNEPRLLANAASLYSVRASAMGERGLMAEAVADQLVAYQLAEQTVALEPDSAVAKQNLAQSARLLGRWYISRGKLDESGKLFREALALNERVYAENPGDVRSKRDLGQSLTYLINYNLETARPAEALPLCRRKLAIAQELAAGNASNLVFQNDGLVAQSNLADTLLELREYEAAQVQVTAAIELARRLAAKGSRFAESEMPNLALRLLQCGEKVDNAAILRGWMAQAERMLPAEPKSPFAALLKASASRLQARFERRLGNAAAAEKHAVEAVEALDNLAKMKGAGPDVWVEQAAARTELALSRGNATGLDSVIADLSTLAPKTSPRHRAALAMLMLEDVPAARRKPELARDILTPIVQSQPWNASAQRALAIAHAQLLQYREAAAHQERALALLPPPPSDTAWGKERTVWNEDLAKFRALSSRESR
jgi:eukaryotic-like serine/threonine-protein kinase